MFCFLNILSFLCCWYLVETKHTKKERDFFTSTSFFVWGVGGGGGGGGGRVCAERDLTQEGSRKQT